MFLESITVSGFIDIGEPRKEIFRLQQNVNICSISSTFLEGFSVIFDPKYDASYDLTEFIKDQFTGKSFVKVELWQSNEDTLVAFNWLKKTRLVIERDLQKPNQVLVNESVMNINAFHQAIASFGFITIDGFQLHRLLKNEINQISCFSGENLWNLVTGLFNSEGLVQVIDFKQKKRRIINDQIIRQMDQLETELPSKLKIRDEIQQHFKLIRRFNTLVAVNNERKLHHLEKQRDALQNEQTQLIDELKLRSREIGKLQAKHEVQTLERKIREKMLELTHRERKVTPEGLLNGQISDESLTNGISELLTKVLSTQADIVQTLENLDKQNKFTGEHQALQSEIFGHLNAIDWRISLKEVQDKDEFQKRVEMFKQTLSAEERNASEISKEVEETDMKIDICRVKAKELKTLEVEEFVNQTKQHYQAQLPLVKRILALNEGILGNTQEALEIKLQIDIVAMEGGFDSSYVETLLNIETLVMIDQNLSLDYHGPVFQYLKDRSNLDQKLWTQLSPIATIFLFARGTTARQVNRMLVESKRNLGHYVFLGIDEFTPKASTEIPEEIKNLVDSAESLIGINERFGKILKPLLREIVLMKDIESAADNFEHFICSKEVRNVFTSGFLTNEILSDIQTESPLLYLQNIYDNVKEYASLMLRIEESKKLKPNLEEFLKKNQEKLLSLRKKALLSKSSLPFKELLDLLQLQFLQKKRFMQKQANIQNMHELEITDEKINFWKIDELEKSRDMRLNELKLKSKEVEIQELTQQVELRISHVTIETGTEILSSCLNKLSHFVDTDSSAKLFDMMENYRKSTDVKIEAIRRELSKPSTAAPSSVMKLQIELNETRCRLNEKNSECEVVDHAIKLCSPPGAIDTKLFEAMRNQDITKELDECFKQLQTESSSKINLLSTEQYVHLAQSIKNVNKFNEAPEPMLSRNKLASKSFPLINKFAVKVLKDAISNFRTSFSYVMEDYARKSTLYFYTRGSFDELKEEDFSWNSFDMARLKALDFLVKWGRDSREKVSQSSLSKIKGLLLIAHIINYLSVFKFIIIDESLYNTMDESLAKKLRTFLETVSQFIQIVYLEKADQTMQH